MMILSFIRSTSISFSFAAKKKSVAFPINILWGFGDDEGIFARNQKKDVMHMQQKEGCNALSSVTIHEKN
jgi:hypothetical protein